jgi:hypothetical protein
MTSPESISNDLDTTDPLVSFTRRECDILQRSLVLALVTILLLVSCAAPPTATPPLTPTRSVWSAEYTPSVSTEEMSGKKPEEIVRSLVDRWLNHFKTAAADSDYRLDGYEIKSVDLSEQWRLFVNDGSLYLVASIHLSVKPSMLVDTSWAAGSGEISGDGWIRNKSLIVGVIKDDKVYILRIVG